MGTAFFVCAQSPTLFFKDAVKAKRDTFYNRTLRSINKTFSLPLDSNYTENWQSAFYNINLLNIKSKKVDAVIKNIAPKIAKQNDACKREFLNLINNKYPKVFFNTVKAICNSTTEDKLQAMCIHYLLKSAATNEQQNWILKKLETLFATNKTSAILHELAVEIKFEFNKQKQPQYTDFLDSTYLPNTTIVFSFQKSDRNYPGIVMIRKADGHFLKNDNGTFFYTGQLARSLSNMPGYISNGNTPQGIFKMNGFDTSKNYFIGPTTNIQLSMPFESSRVLINNDEVDTSWTLEQYKNLLPKSFQNYDPIYGSYYAGKAGRTEIIAHGTTVNPTYYKGLQFYPYTPTAGCLATIELWNENNGTLQKSNQYLLTQALQKAGGAKGYLIVIDIDHNSSEEDSLEPAIKFNNILPFLH